MGISIDMEKSSLDEIIGYNPFVTKDNLSDYKEVSKHDQIETMSVSECLRLHSGKLKVFGTIISISTLYKMIRSVVFICNLCSDEQLKIYEPPIPHNHFQSNQKKCIKCNESSITSQFQYINAVTVNLKDLDKFSEIEELLCILFDDDTKDIQLGTKVVISGNIHIINQKNKKSVSCLFAYSLEYENTEQLELTPIDIEAIERFTKLSGPSTIDSLAKMFAPLVIGLDIVKKGLLLSAVSSGDDVHNKNGNRDRINVLLVGKPGIGKSKLIKDTPKLIPNSRYESVQHSSGKSLTAIVSKENDDYCLRLGPIPLARGSLCVLNEIGSMSSEDQGFLLDVMEEGEFTINKHGINAKIKSPTVVIASCNPVGFTWHKANNDHDGNNEIIDSKIDLEQIPLNKPVIDRFDLVYAIIEPKDEKSLRDYVDKKAQNLKGNIPDYYPYLKKHVKYAKRFNPVLTDESISRINEYYINLVRSPKLSPNFKSKRTLETLYRIAKSFSKLKLKKAVDIEDAKEALEFFNVVIYQFVNSTVMIPDDPKNIAISVLIDILRNSAFAYSLEELAKIACEGNDYVKSYLLGGNKNKSNIYSYLLKIENNKKLRNIYNLLIGNSNIKIVNEKPIALQWVGFSSVSDPSDPRSSANNKINSIDNNKDDGSSKNGRSDRSDRSDAPTIKNCDGLENKRMLEKEDCLNKSVIAEILKSEPMMRYKEPFFYCKECPKVQFVNHEEIKNHLIYSKVHKST